MISGSKQNPTNPIDHPTTNLPPQVYRKIPVIIPVADT